MRLIVMMAATHRSGAVPVKVLMVAIGGYGYYYLRTLLDEISPQDAVLAGVVDPMARLSRAWEDVEALRVPVCETVEAYYEAGHTADLAVVVSPIHCHVPQSVTALEHGTAVLCDKPIAASVQDVHRLLRARDQARLPVTVGYQWSFSDTIQALKHDLLAGLFGRPRTFVTLCCWPRTPDYYTRNSWAGRMHDSDTGALVLDSPANNAMAHFLHNACFLLGDDQHSSGTPVEVCAELYRGHAIESADTAACRAHMDNGADVVFLASHTTGGTIAPRFRIECDEAVITFGEGDRVVTATSRSGATRHYGDPDATPQFAKLHAAIAMARGPGVPLCGIEAAGSQTVCINAMHDSVPDIVAWSADRLHTREDGGIAVNGLSDDLERCYGAGRLPSEMGFDWARGGRVIPTARYRHYPGGAPPATAADAQA